MRAAKNGHQLTVEFLVSKGACLVRLIGDVPHLSACDVHSMLHCSLKV